MDWRRPLKVVGIIAGTYLIVGGLLKLDTPLDFGMPPVMQVVMGGVIMFVAFRVLR